MKKRQILFLLINPVMGKRKRIFEQKKHLVFVNINRDFFKDFLNLIDFKNKV